MPGHRAAAGFSFEGGVSKETSVAVSSRSPVVAGRDLALVLGLDGGHRRRAHHPHLPRRRHVVAHLSARAGGLASQRRINPSPALLRLRAGERVLAVEEAEAAPERKRHPRDGGHHLPASDGSPTTAASVAAVDLGGDDAEERHAAGPRARKWR